MFEATVLDSAPVFSLFRETLPAAKVRGFSAVFNSNYKRDSRNDGSGQEFC